MEKMFAIDQVLEHEYWYQSWLMYTGMLENALTAYAEQENDPYTTYFSPKINSGFLSMLKGNQDFVGIGAVVNKKDTYILVEEVLKKSPASRAGLQAMDHILSIDEMSVKDMTIDEAVSKMRGEEHTQVVLEIAREQEGRWDTLDLTITREKIMLPSVYTKILTGENIWGKQKILYIELILIWEETDSLLKQKLAELDEQTIKNLKGIIVDVRDNWGGYMPIAVDIVSHFIPKDTLVASAKYTAFPEEKYYSKGLPHITGKNIVVLMNKHTASAGEIIALALKELAGAKLLGEKTFWKGSVQTMKAFKDGSSLKYTIGKRYSPKGENIDKKGILPDIQLEFDVEKYILNEEDNQLQKAIELLSK